MVYAPNRHVTFRTLLRTIIAALTIVGTSHTLRASPTAESQAQPAYATAEDAKPFLGKWTTTFDSPQGSITFDVEVQFDVEVHMDSGDPQCRIR
jgi:hypothetical protein